jgi:uncharacterized protein YndB with AHSA1/START domain
MASVTLEADVAASAETVWRALADFGAAHRVFAPVLADCRGFGDGTRVATFANGEAVTERIVGIDAARRRLAYTVLDRGFAFHHAAMRVVAKPDGGARFIWTCDVLPDVAAERIRSLMEAGAAALRQTFEGGDGAWDRSPGFPDPS